jgi:hypothetical protein
MSNETDWEHEISGLLSELAETQGELLEILSYKQQQLAGKSEFSPQDADREIKLLERLHDCHTRRTGLLETAKAEGKPAASLRTLADSLPEPQLDAPFRKRFRKAEQQSKLIQHRCLTQWLVAQRTLIHLSQMLEILATGGRNQPTYGKGPISTKTGGLMDHNA